MSTNRKRIQAYVNLSTYEFLKSQAQEKGISLSELVGDILQTTAVSEFSNPLQNSPQSRDCVSQQQLAEVIDELRKDMQSEIYYVLNRAEAQWEANAAAIVSTSHSMMKTAFNTPEVLEEALKQFE